MNKMTKEQIEVADRVMGKLAKIAKSKDIEPDDVRQEALIAIWQAHGKYDESKGVPYIAWLYQYAYLTCLTYINSNGGAVQASAKVNLKYKFTKTSLDKPGAIKPTAKTNLESDYFVREVLAKLPEQKRQWLLDIMDGATDKESAHNANCSTPTANKWRQHVKGLMV